MHNGINATLCTATGGPPTITTITTVIITIIIITTVINNNSKNDNDSSNRSNSRRTSGSGAKGSINAVVHIDLAGTSDDENENKYENESESESENEKDIKRKGRVIEKIGKSTKISPSKTKANHLKKNSVKNIRSDEKNQKDDGNKVVGSCRASSRSKGKQVMSYFGLDSGSDLESHSQ